jgi:hypothetical protein
VLIAVVALAALAIALNRRYELLASRRDRDLDPSDLRVPRTST